VRVEAEGGTIMYRVAWKSLLTNVSGYGKYCLTKTIAKAWVKYGNEKFCGKITHWIEGPHSQE